MQCFFEFLCANYFAFNELSVRFFNNDRELMDKYTSARKRFIIINNSEETNLERAMMQQSVGPEILYMKSGTFGKKSIDGDIMESDDARARSKAFLNADSLLLDLL